MPTTEKTAVIEQLQSELKEADAVFLADFTGLDVASMTKLRRKCHENGVSLHVVKNTLAVKASRANQLDGLVPHLKGATAVAVAKGDPSAPARILREFQKENDKLKLKAGVVEGQILSGAEVTALANLPSRDQLISQVMQLALAPTQSVVYVLNGLLAKVVRTVDAVRDGMEKGTIASAAAKPAASAATAAPPSPEDEAPPAG
ncbi:MAG TPA: 50S ribosomal protein L10 [bacterium]|nr:50S ribosomal protein L10 [bacterium]